jgi:hypothetical protein
MELIRWLLAVHASSQQRGRVAAAKLSGVAHCRRRSGCLCHAPQHCCHPPGTRPGSVHALRQVDIEHRCDSMGPSVTWESVVSRMYATSRSKSHDTMAWMAVDKTMVLILRAVDTLDELMEPESCRHLRKEKEAHLRTVGDEVKVSAVKLDACALIARIFGTGLRGGALKPGTSIMSCSRRHLLHRESQAAIKTIIKSGHAPKRWVLWGKQRLSSMMRQSMIPYQHYAWSFWGQHESDSAAFAGSIRGW